MGKGISRVLFVVVICIVSSTNSSRAETVCNIISTFISNIDVGITSTGNGLVDVYYVNPSENLVRNTVDPRSPAVISGVNLGGVARSEPSAISWGPGHSAAFVRGSNGALWYLQRNNGVESGWLSLGGQVTWNPGAVALGPNHMMVFYRGTNRQLWYLEYLNGSWGPHTSLSGVLTSSPIAVSWGDNHVAVFTRGQANDLWYRERNGSSWGAWVGLGGNFGTDPVAVARGVGLMDVFVRGNIGRTMKISSSGGAWGSWIDLGNPPGGTLSEPGAAVSSSGALTVFARGQTFFSGFAARDIYQRTSVDGGASWSDWSIANGPFASPSTNNPEATGHAFGGWTVAATNFPGGAQTGQLRLCSTF
jgi:hypothetical protein